MVQSFRMNGGMHYGSDSTRASSHDRGGRSSDTPWSRDSESLRVLSKRCAIDRETVAKWKRRRSVVDLPTGPKEVHSTALSSDEEAIVVAFRRYRFRLLDDCLSALQPSIPHLTRSSVHRCLQQHGISRLPDVGGDKPASSSVARSLTR